MDPVKFFHDSEQYVYQIPNQCQIDHGPPPKKPFDIKPPEKSKKDKKKEKESKK